MGLQYTNGPVAGTVIVTPLCDEARSIMQVAANVHSVTYHRGWGLERLFELCEMSGLEVYNV